MEEGGSLALPDGGAAAVKYETWHHLERERHLEEAKAGNRMTAAITTLSIWAFGVVCGLVWAWVQ